MTTTTRRRARPGQDAKIGMAKNLVPAGLLAQAARRFHLLGEPVRLQILNAIYQHGELNVQEIVAATGQQQANVSKHLRLMAEAGLVDCRRDGLYAYYFIDDPSLSSLCVLACSPLEARESA